MTARISSMAHSRAEPPPASPAEATIAAEMLQADPTEAGPAGADGRMVAAAAIAGRVEDPEVREARGESLDQRPRRVVVLDGPQRVGEDHVPLGRVGKPRQA